MNDTQKAQVRAQKLRHRGPLLPEAAALKITAIEKGDQKLASLLNRAFRGSVDAEKSAVQLGVLRELLERGDVMTAARVFARIAKPCGADISDLVIAAAEAGYGGVPQKAKCPGCADEIEFTPPVFDD